MPSDTPTDRPALEPAPAHPAAQASEAEAALFGQIALAGRVIRTLQAQLARATELMGSLDERTAAAKGACERAASVAAELACAGRVETPIQSSAPAAASPAPRPEEDGASDGATALHALIDELVGRCAALERERAEAAGAERALLAGLHDELRAGLEEVSGTLESLQKSRLDERQRDLVAPALVSLGALAELVGGLRGLAPAGAGATGAPGGEPFDLREAVHGVTELVGRRAEARGVVLAWDVAVDVPPMVIGDRSLLRQVTLYLAHTAVKLAGSGRVELTVRLDAGAPEKAAIRVCATHEGAGIDPALLGEGADGVPGLAVARRLAERMGGRLGVESEEHRRFALWFTAVCARPDRMSADRRTENRLRVVGVESNVGPVIDLSLGGARVTSRRKLEGRIELEVRAGQDEGVRVDADVIWSRRAAWRRFESALRFLDVSPECARRLTRLSLEHRMRAMLGGDG